MQNNVIYGAFPPALDNTSLARVDDNTPARLNSRIHASLKVLNDLSGLIEDSGLPKEHAEPLRTKLNELQTRANELAQKLIRSHTDDSLFLQLQTDTTEFGKQLVEFEADVMHKTGAELELVEAPAPPVLQQIGNALAPTGKWVNNPKFWVGLSVGVAALGGLVWWGLHREPAKDKEDFTTKVQRVKLRRAMPAR